MREQQLGITLSIIGHNSRESGISVINIVKSKMRQYLENGTRYVQVTISD